MNLIDVIENEQLRSDHPQFGAGDTVRVHVKLWKALTKEFKSLKASF